MFYENLQYFKSFTDYKNPKAKLRVLCQSGVIFVFGYDFLVWVSTHGECDTLFVFFLTFSDSLFKPRICVFALAGVRWFKAYLNHMRNLNKKYNSGDVDYEYHHIIKGLYTTCSSWHIDPCQPS